MEQGKTSESTFILLCLESLKYILEKNIDPKQQKAEIVELGIHLGDKISNHLMNSQSSNKATPSSSQIQTVISFLGDDIWTYIFDKQAKISREKISYILETTNIKFHSFLISEKSSANDDKLDPTLWFVEGIIKGVFSSFNLECDVSSSFKRPQTSGDNTDKSSRGIFDPQYSYIFEITLLES